MSFWMQKNFREHIVPTLTLQFCAHYSIEIGSFLLRLETFSKRDEPHTHTHTCTTHNRNIKETYRISLLKNNLLNYMYYQPRRYSKDKFLNSQIFICS